MTGKAIRKPHQVMGILILRYNFMEVILGTKEGNKNRHRGCRWKCAVGHRDTH